MKFNSHYYIYSLKDPYNNALIRMMYNHGAFRLLYNPDNFYDYFTTDEGFKTLLTEINRVRDRYSIKDEVTKEHIDNPELYAHLAKIAVASFYDHGRVNEYYKEQKPYEKLIGLLLEKSGMDPEEKTNELSLNEIITQYENTAGLNDHEKEAYAYKTKSLREVVEAYTEEHKATFTQKMHEVNTKIELVVTELNNLTEENINEKSLSNILNNLDQIYSIKYKNDKPLLEMFDEKSIEIKRLNREFKQIKNELSKAKRSNYPAVGLWNIAKGLTYAAKFFVEKFILFVPNVLMNKNIKILKGKISSINSNINGNFKQVEYIKQDLDRKDNQLNQSLSEFEKLQESLEKLNKLSDKFDEKVQTITPAGLNDGKNYDPGKYKTGNTEITRESHEAIHSNLHFIKLTFSPIKNAREQVKRKSGYTDDSKVTKAESAVEKVRKQRNKPVNGKGK